MNQLIHDQLIAKRTELVNRLAAIEADLQKGRSQDFSEYTTESENDEVLDEIHIEAKKELKLVGEAIQRLENDQYGACVNCGEQIATKRLQALPYTTSCIDCAQ
ncbi:TraR/DksA family transcriptional regulator [Endozoicomonas sp. G2_1]|uniref:TraR/DksA family transcriptional regulator n=1 Tax=Endozoicomonas sp. G2_1 TaxID=2821091 RepID=UPI001ADA4381|nr:TraR/DksA family transcriptional regulator [Endozoicomonas sp. G2_1]MBO9490325.1 TraR/DksA family transcriptional regulator [Endozoicomonas sp. G2_1]